MEVVHAVPTESLSEKLSVQRLSDKLELAQMRANVFTLAEGSMLRHLHREQEELYVVLDGTALIDVDDARHKLGERDALSVPTGAWHRVSNAGMGPLTFLVVAAPPITDDAEIEAR
jgi:mannose-6-phosphate isomerase-like protein (cupin superfamily)